MNELLVPKDNLPRSVTSQIVNSSTEPFETLLSDHQKEIFRSIIALVEERIESPLRSNNVEDYMISLSGAAGTGKTFLTTQLAKYFKSKNNLHYAFTLTSPTHKATGVAAQMLRDNNIQAPCRTIHSFLGIKPFKDYDKGVEKFVIDKTQKQKSHTAILFVDESSMISSELYKYIVEAWEQQRVAFIIFVGDPYQLLPIGDSDNRIYKLKNQFILTEVVRQAQDSYILKIATELRYAIEKQQFISLDLFFKKHQYSELEYFHNEADFIKSFHKHPKWYNQDKIIAAHKNQNVDAFNRIIRQIFWEQRGVNNAPTLLKGDRLRFKEAYSVRDISLYHNGQVIEIESTILKNHESLKIKYWECRAVNANEQQIFRVVDPTSMQVFNDKLTTIAKMAKKALGKQKSDLWKLFYDVRDSFADVQYIHASTIHKLQGSTYDETYLDLFSLINNHYMSDDDKYRLTYVAVTRARFCLKIFMSKDSPKDTFEKLSSQEMKINTKKQFEEVDDMLKKFGI